MEHFLLGKKLLYKYLSQDFIETSQGRMFCIRAEVGVGLASLDTALYLVGLVSLEHYLTGRGTRS